jgi:hypothetical protein
MVIDSLKALTDPATITTEIEFPTSYDAAIKWNLAIELAPEYGKDPSGIVIARARESKRIIETKNLANQINAADLSSLGRSGRSYNINEG